MKKFYNRALVHLLVFAGVLFSSGSLLSQVVAIPIQMPECTADVPGYQIDLSSNPNLTFTTPEVLRQPTCCGDGDRYLAFYVTLHPDVAMIEVVVAPGYADPGGSGNYQQVTGGDLVTPGLCGTQQDAGSPLCIVGPGPHKILYSKPGGNLVKYIFRQIPKPIYPASQPTRLGCSLPLPIYGLNNISISATSKSGNCLATLPQLTSFLSCTNCESPSFTAGAITGQTYPYNVTYTVTGTPKAAACGVFPTSGTFTVTVYDQLTATITTDATSYCESSAGTWLVAHPGGGLAPYSYVWKNGSTIVPSPQGDSLLVNSPGGYTCTVSDQLITTTCGSVTSNTLSITEGNEPVITATSNNVNVCSNNPSVNLSGTIQYATGGSWSGGTGTFSPSSTSFGSYANTATPISTTYTPTANDINNGSITLYLKSTGAVGGCTNDSIPIIVNFIDSIHANPTASPISCYGGNTTLTAAGSGGVGGPYTYSWSTNPVSTGTSTTTTAGTYLVTVQDSYGCRSTTSITVSEPSQINLSLSSTIDNIGAPCDGTASVIAAGGTGGYTYNWSPGTPTGDGSASISDLCYGLYSVLVTDANACTMLGYVVVSNFTCQSFDVAVSTHTDVSCNGGADGTATASIVSGGNSPYDFQWTNSSGLVVSTTNDVAGPNTATALSAGSYTVLVTDNLGCMDVAGVSITEPTALNNTMSHVDVSFIGGNNGSATANPSGGTPGYSYAWTTTSGSFGSPTNGQTVTGLTSGVGGVKYYVDITDAKLCTYEDSVLINQPPCNDFQIAVNTVDALCDNDSNGQAFLVITNGTGPYTIVWSGGTPGPGNMSVTGLSANSYTVNVTDITKNCSTFTTFAIAEPSPLSLGLVPTNITCNGDRNGAIDLTVSGGTYPFQYTWSAGGKFFSSFEDLSNLGPNTYTVTVTDANNCNATSSIGISQPTQLSGTHTRVDNPCYGNSLGSATATATSGTGVFPYLYSWTGPSGYIANGSVINNLPSGLYTYTITDLNGCTFQENVNINQPLLLTASAVMTNQVTCLGGTDGAADLTVTGGTESYTYLWSNGSTLQDPANFTAGTFNVTVTDAHSCIATTSVAITTVLDVTDPVITCPSNQTVNTSTTTCTYTHSGTAWNATATDNCVVNSVTYLLSGATVTTIPASSLNGQIFNLGTTTVTWTATDGLGNTDACSYNVTVEDKTAPIITSCGVTTAITVVTDPGTCTYTQGTNAWNPTATDNCSGVFTYAYTLTGATTGSGATLNGVTFNKGVTNVVWVVTDANGNTASCNYTVTVNDNQAPSFVTCGTGSPYVVSADAGVCTYTHSGTTWNATATDICAGPVTIGYALTGATTGVGTSLNGQIFNKGVTTVTWTATDGSSNFATCTYTVTVNDTEDPVISCIAAQTVSTSSSSCTYTHSGNAWNATATDNCSGTITYSYSLSGATTGTGTSLSGKVFNLGVTTVTWTATDISLNSSTCSFVVTVEDKTAPIITSCGVTTAITVVTDPGTCTYTQGTNAWNPTATDNCSGVFTYAYTLTGATTGSGATLNGVTFLKGTTTVNWIVTDANGNSSSCSFIVTVQDNQSPSITCPVSAPYTVTTDLGLCTHLVSGTAWDATATDFCGVTSLTYSLSGVTTGTGTSLNGKIFNKGITTVTWTARDAAGNSSTCNYTVTVSDQEDPSILSCGVTTSVTVSSNPGVCTYTHQTDTWNATATDNCSAVSMSYQLTGATSGSGSSLAGQTFSLGTTTVTWTATDGSGNTQTCFFDVIVEDNQLPLLTSCGAPGDLQVSADASQCNFTQTGTVWDAEATDNCSIASLTYTLTGATTGSGISLQNVDFNLGLTTVTWTVIDGSNNSSNCNFDVLVVDNQLPVINTCGAGDQTVSADNGVCTYAQTADVWDAIASDNCTVSTLTYSMSGATTGTGTTLDGVTFGLGSTTVIWTAKDNSNNLSTCTYTITVIDDQDPGIANCPSDITVGVDAGNCGAVVNWTAPTFSDNCGFTFTASHNPGDYFIVGTTTVTYTVTDGSGNVSVCTFDVTVNDDELPTISCSGNIASCDPLITYSAPVVGDNCGTPTVIQTAGLASGVVYPVGMTTNTYQVTDIHNNTATCTFTVTIHPLPVASTTDVDVTCNGNDNGTIDLTVTNGTTAYTYDWSNGATTEDLSGLAPGTYSVDITDANNCTTSASATITEPEVLTLDAVDNHVNCYNGNDGAIDISIAGGTLPYSYDWSNNAATEDISGLIQGAYDVTVTDFKGCTVTYSTVIDQPDTLVIQTAVYDATCNAANGSIQNLTTGGTTPYTYSWSDGSNGANLNNVVAGTYSLTVLDAQGCIAQFSGTINSVSNLSGKSLVRDARCYGQANGEIQIIMESGNEPYFYDWSNGASTELNDSLTAGSYSVTVTDLFGCQITMDITVEQPDSLVVTLSTSSYVAGTNISLFGGEDGWITSTVSGGTPVYTYLWTPGNETTEDIQNLEAGSYTVLVQDRNGCTASASVRLSEPLALDMPEGFSPNGDGANDNFVIRGIEAYPDNDIVVYNRWGNVVYEFADYQNEWNGDNTKGEPLPDATYFVIVKVYASADETITLKGYVDLRR